MCLTCSDDTLIQIEPKTASAVPATLVQAAVEHADAAKKKEKAAGSGA